MTLDARNRSLVTLRDYTPREIAFLIKFAADLKTTKYGGTEVPRLQVKNISLIFEKDSPHTRIGFEIAAFDQGVSVNHLGQTGSHIGQMDDSLPIGGDKTGMDARIFAPKACRPAQETGARIMISEGVGNFLAKQLIYLSGAVAAVLVLSARVPIMLTSRSDSHRARKGSAAIDQRYVHRRPDRKP